MGTLDNGLKREWLRLTAENARLRAALLEVQKWDSIWGALPDSLAATVRDAIVNEQSVQPKER